MRILIPWWWTLGALTLRNPIPLASAYSSDAFVAHRNRRHRSPRISSLRASTRCSDPFLVSMNELDFPKQNQQAILSALTESGLMHHIDDLGTIPATGTSSSFTLQLIAQDFVDRPEVLSSCLQTDFGLQPLIAHQTRAAILHALRRQQRQEQVKYADPKATRSEPITPVPVSVTNGVAISTFNNVKQQNTGIDTNAESPPLPLVPVERRPLYKSIVVNKPAKQRRTQSVTSRDYGLPRNYSTLYPQLAIELDYFMDYMTRPTTDSQEDPIRPATAIVYLRHAKLFLGWYVHEYCITTATTDDCLSDAEKRAISIFTIIPTKEKDSADSILEFLLWLRSVRQISVSYEANFLRGLTKLIKFRFRKESLTDPAYGQKSFEDIPLIRELRKWHRDADKKRAVAPRSSDESQKWLSWPEYLQVVKHSRDNLAELLREYEQDDNASSVMKKTAPVAKDGSRIRNKDDMKDSSTTYSPQQRKIATAFQKYLVLAFFSNIPDRQRTIRELELNRSFVMDDTGCWCIRHRPDDYKTGKTYGERPPLQLSASLTPAIDDFLKRWRPCLCPTAEQFFVQPRTGNPLTRDSVYQIVGRSCYQYTGKRTNPHLLRDMIVTHVRESSDASEKELEALALFMGHSVHMQRTSYDRRTLDQKVAPAVQLLESVNAKVTLE